MTDLSKAHNNVAVRLARSLKFLVVATCVLYLVIGIAGVKIYLDGRNTARALCSLRTDIRERVSQSTAFLQANPNGTPGIPMQLIVDGLRNQQRTAKALSNLNCVSSAE